MQDGQSWALALHSSHTELTPSQANVGGLRPTLGVVKAMEIRRSSMIRCTHVEMPGSEIVNQGPSPPRPGRVAAAVEE